MGIEITKYKTFRPQNYLFFRVMGQKDDEIVFIGEWKTKIPADNEWLKLWNDNRTIFYFIERGKFLISTTGKASRI